MEIEDLSQELSQFLDDGGILLGIPIAGLSLLLFLAGYRLLPIVTMIVGIAVGYVLSPQIIPIATDIGILDPLQITNYLFWLWYNPVQSSYSISQITNIRIHFHHLFNRY